MNGLYLIREIVNSYKVEGQKFYIIKPDSLRDQKARSIFIKCYNWYLLKATGDPAFRDGGLSA